MRNYLNPSSIGFRQSLRSKIYIDKSLLIGELNEAVCTENCYVCTSRPRRFGKSFGLKMLSAYYKSNEDTHDIFNNLKIASCPTYEEHINKYEVVWIDMQEVLSKTHNVGALIDYLTSTMLAELREKYGINEEQYLSDGFNEVFEKTQKQFVFLIDEWDCVMREMRSEKEQQERYLDFLRGLFKGQNYVAMAYMTGILPIKKYGTHSALNMFRERSITSPGSLAEYFGFTEEETRALCEQYNKNFEEVRKWYDGYELKRVRGGVVDYIHIFNPNSLVNAMLNDIECYWGPTEQMEALRRYIDLDFEGLQDSITRLLAWEKVDVDISRFSNDMQTFYSKDDILTLLIHLGYLTYDAKEKQAYIPNYEVSEEFREMLIKG